MLQALFTVPVLVTELVISERERSVLCERALAAYRANNTNGKPWSRATRESLEVQEPAFEALLANHRSSMNGSFGCPGPTGFRGFGFFKIWFIRDNFSYREC